MYLIVSRFSYSKKLATLCSTIRKCDSTFQPSYLALVDLCLICVDLHNHFSRYLFLLAFSLMSMHFKISVHLNTLQPSSWPGSLWHFQGLNLNSFRLLLHFLIRFNPVCHRHAYTSSYAVLWFNFNWYYELRQHYSGSMEPYCAMDRRFWEHASITYCNLWVPAAYKNQSSLPFFKQNCLASRDAQPYL